MRVRFGWPMPGPFVVTPGGSRRGPGCGWLLIVMLMLTGLVFAHPWAGVVLLAVIVLLLIAAHRERNRR